MSRFETGVKYYTTGTARVQVYFPEDLVNCLQCKFCRAEKELRRYRCMLTDDIVFAPDFGVGENCPIEFEEEKHADL